jgi:hypothetical protein
MELTARAKEAEPMNISFSHSSISLMVPLSVALFVASVSVIPARADIIVFDNFGPGDSYNVNAGSTLGAIPGHPDLASRFSVGASSVYLSSVDVAISLVDRSPSTPSPDLNDIDILVMTDAGGLPGSVLETFHFVNAMGSFGSLIPPLDPGRYPKL